MLMKLGKDEFDAIRAYIELHFGISLGANKGYIVESRLARIVAEAGCRSFGEFYVKLRTGVDARLRDQIMDAITTHETLWFRDGSPWEIMRDVVLPEFCRQIRAAPSRRFRIWSAGCSTGQEPYSIAMLIDDFCSRPESSPLRPEEVQIVATDLSPAALGIAREGRYNAVAMNRGLEGQWQRFRQRYFEQRGSCGVLDPAIRGRVFFERLNLQDQFTHLGLFDVVFLRNVTIYFSDQFKAELFGRVRNALRPAGFLLLGLAERLLGDENGLEIQRRGTYYRLSPGVNP